MLGVIYQFYYGGGDTFNYFQQSVWIFRAFFEEPVLALKLLLESGGARQPDTFQYSQHIWYYNDPHSYTVVKVAGFFDLFTFHTYSATALFFSAFSFSGLWAMYTVLVKKYNDAGWLSIAVLFVPSIVFWGSGILKDSLTIGALGWLTFALIQIIDFKKISPILLFIIVINSYFIFTIKSYILICFLPMIFVWVYWKGLTSTRNFAVRFMVAPILLVVFGLAGYFTLSQVSSQSSQYSLDQIAEKAAVTAYDIRYGWGARTGGDGGYDLGTLDGSWGSMVRLMPQAINVSLFRPYLWEVKNPVMLLAALESLTALYLTFYLLIYKKGFSRVFQDPFLLFCLLFSLLFAFGVGVSTYNFGTLMRYKIPLLPFYFTMIVRSRKKNVSRL